MYLYPDGLKKVQTCTAIVLQNGRRAKSSLAMTATDSIPSQKQQKLFLRFSECNRVVKGMGDFQNYVKGTGNSKSHLPFSTFLQVLKDLARFSRETR